MGVVTKIYKHDFEAEELAPAQQSSLEEAVLSRFPTRSCTRVLFVAVPQIPEDVFSPEAARAGRYPCFPPYGPGILVRILEQAGYHADLIDLNFSVLSRAHEKGVFDLHSWRRELIDKVNEFKPDMIGLSCMFNLGHSWLRSVSSLLRDAFPALPLAAGGVHPTLTTQQLMEDVPELDFVFLYEADRALHAFLDFVNGGAPGSELAQLACRDGGQIIKLTKRSPVPELSFSPDYKGLPIERYSEVGKIGAYTFLRSTSAIASTALSARGCRAQCGFCSVRSVNGPGVRTREVSVVVDEVERLVREYGVEHIMWLDDDLFYNHDRAVVLFSLLAERKLGITWDASNGIIAAALSPELLRACVASGCVGFNIGIESGNPEMLKMMKKPGTVQSFRKAALMLRETPEIFTKGFLVIGFPNETVAMLRDSVSLALEMGLDWYPIQVLTPMVGTPIFKMMQDQGLLGDIPTVTLGKARTFSVGATGSIQKREREEKEHAKPYCDVLEGDLARVPSRAELEDFWFTIDYKINYEPILGMTDERRLSKKAAMLAEICERMTTDNALGFLFLGLTKLKLGEEIAPRLAALESRRCLEESEFWHLRFEALGLDEHLAYLERSVV